MKAEFGGRGKLLVAAGPPCQPASAFRSRHRIAMTAPLSPIAGPRLRRYDILWIAGIFLLSQAATAGVVVLVMKGASLLSARWEPTRLQPETSQAALVAAIITAGIILTLGGYWLARRRGIDLRSFGLGGVRWYWLLVAVILFALFNWADGAISDWLDPSGQLREDLTEGFFPMRQSLPWAVAVAVAIGPVTAAGGTKRHRELLAPFGLDAADPAFWGKGLSVIAGLIDKLEKA
jgi:hypothetical protein